MLRNLMICRSPENEGGGGEPSPPSTPQSTYVPQPTDPHSDAVSQALNEAAQKDDSGLDVADQPAVTERSSRSQEEPSSDIEREIRDLLTFDPLAEDAGEHPASKKAKSQAEAPSEGRDKVPQPDKSSVQAKDERPQEAQQEPPQTDELKQLRADLAQAQRTIAELARRGTQESQPKPQVEDLEEQERTRLQGIYAAWGVPDAIVDALGSENASDRKMALSSLVQTLAREVHLNTLKDVSLVLETSFRQLPQMVQGHVQQHSTRSDMNQDLYSAHPDLNRPLIRKEVPNIALAVARELGATQWNSQLRDAVAQRVRREFGLQQPQATQVPQAPVPSNGNGQVRPPAAFRTSTRSQPRGYASREQEDIMRTFDLD